MVYKCWDPDIRRIVAIKKLDRQYHNKAGHLADLQFASRLNHPNIVSVFDVDVDAGIIVMEYVGGGTLETRISKDQSWARDHFNELADDISEGLRAAHAVHLLHRDIKPANILITSDGRAKIADFGVCAALDSTRAVTSTHAGTLPYMSREVLLGNDYSYEADIHSLGCMFYEILSGRLPWNGSTIHALIALKSNNIPEQLFVATNGIVDDLLSNLVSRMIARDTSRISEMEIVIQQLARRRPVLNGAPRTIDHMQLHLGGIYGYVNSGKSPLYFLSRYFVSQRGIAEALTRHGPDSDALDSSFVKSFGWLCAVASSVNVRISELVWLKYPGTCPHCSEQICQCGERWRDEPVPRNVILSHNVSGRMIASAPRARSFSHYCAMFARIYGESNIERGVPFLVSRAYSETAEAVDAFLHLLSSDSGFPVTILHLEMSDLVAWFFALLNSSSRAEHFEAEFEALFGSGCFACHNEGCTCRPALAPEDWRDIVERQNVQEAS